MEVEIKFELKGDTLEKIKGIAKFICRRSEADTYFLSPVRDFKKTDEALRIRRENGFVRITYKGPKVDNETKTREEIEVSVDSYENAVELLKRLGFKPFKEIRKVREVYKIGDITICVDDVEGLGRFIEFEKKSDDVDKAKKEIFELAGKLGYDISKSIRKSYLEMIIELEELERSYDRFLS